MIILPYIYVKLQAKKINKKISFKEFKTILTERILPIKEFAYKYHFKITYNWANEFKSSVPTATMSLNNVIVLNSEVVSRLVLIGNEEIYNCIFHSIGHELSHKYDFKVLGFRGNDKKFIRWCNETYADFNSSSFIKNDTKKKLIASILYKKKCKINDRDSYSHPSWERRLNYITNYKFDEQLINQIAKDTKCNNEKLILNITSHYKAKVIVKCL